MSVHDVAVDDPDAGIHDPGYFLAQAGEVGREYGREKMQFAICG
jgi:hypothetical protein